MARAVRKYLERHAEPEVAIADQIDRDYERTVVVPVCREALGFADGFAHAARTSSGRTLAIVVVNARADAGSSTHEQNLHLIEAMCDEARGLRRLSESPPAWIGTLSACDLLLVDRASEGSRFEPKEGVGLARKIGCDIALGLYACGRAGPWIFSTDADAVLPEGYFDGPGRLDPVATPVLLAHPFWHETSREPALARATALYEIFLRYYVAGLAWAGSPYAVHTIGSTLAVSAEAYAAVRGYPNREAGEDFYLVNKAAKIGPVARMRAEPVRLVSRQSDRTPFGTGRGVAQILDAGGELSLYDPSVFTVLAQWLDHLDALVEHRSVDRLLESLDDVPDAPRAALIAMLDDIDARAALLRLCSQAKNPRDLRVRLHTWFDAFRTLKLVLRLSKDVLPRRPWQDAIRVAPFVPRVEDQSTDLIFLRGALSDAEQMFPALTGPTRPEAPRQPKEPL